MDLLYCTQVHINKIKNQFFSIKANIYHTPRRFLVQLEHFV